MAFVGAGAALDAAVEENAQGARVVDQLTELGLSGQVGLAQGIELQAGALDRLLEARQARLLRGRRLGGTLSWTARRRGSAPDAGRQ